MRISGITGFSGFSRFSRFTLLAPFYLSSSSLSYIVSTYLPTYLGWITDLLLISWSSIYCQYLSWLQVYSYTDIEYRVSYLVIPLTATSHQSLLLRFDTWRDSRLSTTGDGYRDFPIYKRPQSGISSPPLGARKTEMSSWMTIHLHGNWCFLVSVDSLSSTCHWWACKPRRIKCNRAV